MRLFIGTIFAYIVQCCLSLRYRIRVTGADRIDRDRGILFLPNHPGEMDPAIVCSKLYPRFHIHPMVVEDFAHMPALRPLMWAMQAVSMPNTDGGLGSYKRLRIEQSLDKAADLMRQGENMVIYPAGRLMHAQVEDLRGTSAVRDLLTRNPDIQIVMVRSRGLMGSSFSWVAHQERPDLGQWMGHALKWLLLNGIFFMPRRDVELELMLAPDDFPRDGDKMKMNRYLEAWYNEHGPEPFTTPSYCFWQDHRLEIVPPPEAGDAAEVEIDAETREAVEGYIRELAGDLQLELHDGLNLQSGVGMDSLLIGDLLVWLDETYFVSESDPDTMQTVGDVMRAVAEAGTHKPGDSEMPTPPDGWLESAPRPKLVPPALDQPIPVSFLRTCDRMGDHVAMADETSGVLTWKRLKLGVILMAEHFRTYPEERVGVMLPAAVGAGVVAAAIQLAGKTPVMINWTLGDANLEHVLKTAELKRIVTSGRFLDKVEGLNMEMLLPYIEPLEDVRRQLSLVDKLHAVLLARRSADALIRRYALDRIDVDSPAVILFTSGSEAAPKGVPLSHANITCNLHAGCAALEGKEHVLYGFLPPFHSFGFTITTMLPLTTGLKVAYYPNPTQSGRLARGIAMWQPTVIAGTPTFVAGIFKASHEGFLDSLKLAVTGAEKTPDDLYADAQRRGVEMIEGYGITETAPVFTMNMPGEERVGVGRPIEGMEALVVDIDSREPLPTGERGLILAHGRSVFAGYLAKDSSDAFCELQGKRWYITGDLGFLDEDGRLTLSGRLKRFVKIGGEMVSLPAMEDAIAAKYPPDDDGHARVAISAVERDGDRPVIAAFCTVETTVEELNGLLSAAGMGNLVRVQKVISLDEIPMLGTGKVDQRALKTQLEEDLAGDGG